MVTTNSSKRDNLNWHKSLQKKVIRVNQMSNTSNCSIVPVSVFLSYKVFKTNFCPRVHVCVCLYVCMLMCMCVHTCAYLCCACVCLYVCMLMCMHVHTCAYLCCAHVCMFVYVHAHVYACSYMYIFVGCVCVCEGYRLPSGVILSNVLYLL